MKTTFLILLIFDTFSINIARTQNISTKKNYIAVETGFIKLLVNDDFINFKTYKGNKYLPIKLSYLHRGNKYQHSLNFYMINTILETDYSKTYYEYDYCNYLGGELSYRFFYNTIGTKKLDFLIGAGILSSGTMRYYYNKLFSSDNQEKFHSNDITATSLLFNILLTYKYNKSFIQIGLDSPFFNYYLRPSEINSIRLDNEYPKKELQAGSFDDFVGLNLYSSVYQHLYRGFYFSVTYNLNYYKIKSNYPMKSIKNQLTAGLSYNF